MIHRKSSKFAAAALGLGIAVVAAGCSSGGSASEEGGGGGGEASDKSITLAVVPGYNDQWDVSQVYKYVLEQNGYTVDIKELSEIALIFTGMAGGDIDASLTVPDTLHKAYWDEYEAQLERVADVYDDSAIYLAVPDYVADVQSIEDLPAHAAEFGGKIIGIEPGSGLTKTIDEQVIPAYGLEGTFEHQTSSTTAMLAALDEATKAQQPIVVGIWKPFWPNSTYKLRKLDDPKEAFGESYAVAMVAHKGFAEEFPEVAEMMAALKLTDDTFNTLDNTIYQEFEKGQEQEAAAAWLEANPDILAALEAPLQD